jgi:hypothetical protein
MRKHVHKIVNDYIEFVLEQVGKVLSQFFGETVVQNLVITGFYVFSQAL